jgi:hypothetical protein
MPGKFGGITKTTRIGNGPGKGAGWGNPPGDHSPTPKQPFTAESTTRISNPDNPPPRLTREEKALRDEDRAEKYRQFIDDTVSNVAASDETRLRASAMGLDRIEGTPVQKTQLTGADGEALKIETIRRVIIDPKVIDVEDRTND